MSNVLSDPASNENGAFTLYREELGQVEVAFCWRLLESLPVSSMALRKGSRLGFLDCIDWRPMSRVRRPKVEYILEFESGCRGCPIFDLPRRSGGRFFREYNGFFVQS